MSEKSPLDSQIDQLCRTAPDLVLWIARNYPKAPDQRDPLDRDSLKKEINSQE